MAWLLKQIDLFDLEYDIEKVIHFGIYLHFYLYAISDCSSMNSNYRHLTLSNSIEKWSILGIFLFIWGNENYPEGQRLGGIYVHTYLYLISDWCYMGTCPYHQHLSSSVGKIVVLSIWGYFLVILTLQMTLNIKIWEVIHPHINLCPISDWCSMDDCY